MSNLKYIFICPAWAPVNGGINAFNHDFCTALAGLDNVICIVPSASEVEKTSALNGNVNLMSLDMSSPEFPEKIEYLIAAKLGFDTYVDVVWIGHDVKTGPIALACSKLNGGTSVVFHHMDYSNYYAHVNAATVESKATLQSDVLHTADIVIGIGPRLRDSAMRMRTGKLRTFELLPGLYSRQGKKPPLDYRVGVAGRITTENDIIKQGKLAAGAASQVLSKQRNGRGAINLIGAHAAEVESLQKEMKNVARVAINPYQYIDNREMYFRLLEQNDVIIMPSLKEGFGLVAWEAVGAEIPVITSTSSGFFEFLQNNDLHSYVTPVVIGDENDEVALADALQSVFDNYKSKEENARSLRQQLSHLTWKSSATQFRKLIEEGVSSCISEKQPQLTSHQKPLFTPPNTASTLILQYQCADTVLPIYDEFEVKLSSTDALAALISRLSLGLPAKVNVSLLDKIDYSSLNIQDTHWRLDDLIELARIKVEQRRTSLENRIELRQI